MTLNLLRQILMSYLATYNDQKAFPPDEYPELQVELEAIRKFLGMN